MITTKEYAYLSEVVYNYGQDGRNDKNQLSEQELQNYGWQIKNEQKQGTHDAEFSAAAFQKGNEVVIAFTGTNYAKTEYTETNIPAGIGLPVNQVKDALDFTLKVLKENPNANITFTGHSLGGGLASMMTTVFN